MHYIPVPIWDARAQFFSNKRLSDGIFDIKKTFELPKLKKGEDLQHGDVVLIYHSVSTYTSKKDTAETWLSFGLYGAILLGRPA